MSGELVVGSVVVLKSHPGVPMTIGSIDATADTAECFWLDDKRKQMRGAFPLAVLMLKPPRKIGI